LPKRAPQENADLHQPCRRARSTRHDSVVDQVRRRRQGFRQGLRRQCRQPLRRRKALRDLAGEGRGNGARIIFQSHLKLTDMARQKEQIIAGVTRERMEEAFGEYGVADARIAEIQADMDVQFTKIREKYADELAELQQTKTNSFEVMQVFA